MLREFALGDQHLAASADAAAAADGIDVDAERARGGEQRRADGKTPALARGREDDERLLDGHEQPLRRGDRYARTLRPRSRRPRPASPLTPGEGASRKRAIHRSQCGSWPIMTSAPMQAWIVSTCSGFVIAEVRPEAIAMVRKALLMPPRFGRPKLTLEAPQVVLTFSSSCSRRTSRMTWAPAWLIAPIGITSGSTTTSLAGMPRSEEHTSELQSQSNLVCRLLPEKKIPRSSRTSQTPNPCPPPFL